MAYVALTPLDEQWLPEEPVAYAEPWWGSSSQRRPENAIPGTFSEEELSRLVEKAQRTYEEVIPHVSSLMNGIHNTDKSRRYWERITCNDIINKIGFIIDRYYRLRKIAKIKNNYKTKILDESCYKIGVEGKGFEREALFSGCFNLQLFSQVADLAGLEYTRVDNETSSREWSISDGLRNVKRSVHNRFLAEPEGVDAPVALCGYGLSPELAKGIDKHSERGVQYFKPDFQPEIQSPDRSLRRIFRRDCGLDGFSQLFLRSLEWNMPLSYVEGYNRYRKFVETHLKDRPDLIIQGNVSTPVVRVWVAECVERGTKVATVQHGAGYGELRNSTREINERHDGDVYATWGWSFEDKDHPMPSPKLSAIRKGLSPVSGASGERILWASRSPRFFRTEGYPFRIEKQLYLNSPRRHTDGVHSFARHLSAESAEQTILRIKPRRFDFLKDFEEGLRGRLFLEIGGISLDDAKRSLAEEARDAKLVVIDHFPATSFLECLALDFPVIAFNRLPLSRFRESVQTEVVALQQTGVVHEDPKEAARLVNEFSEGSAEDVHNWWKEGARREAVLRYRNRFARSSEEYEKEWAAFVDSIS